MTLRHSEKTPGIELDLNCQHLHLLQSAIRRKYMCLHLRKPTLRFAYSHLHLYISLLSYS